MQNKGIVICVAVLLTLASIFYLSFSFATRYYDSEAAKIKDPIAQQDYKDSVKYLGVYSYQNCLETQIGLGLDLKGGMNVILEISVPDVIENLADHKTDAGFTNAMKEARAQEEANGGDFVSLFINAYHKSAPGHKLAEVFATQQLQGKVSPQSSDAEVEKAIRASVQDAIDNSFNVVRTRIDKFGVVQPNIQKLEGQQGRIMVEMPGISQPERMRKMLQGSANLEFWETYNSEEIAPYLQQLDTHIANGDNGEAKNDSEMLQATNAAAEAMKDLTDAGARKEQIQGAFQLVQQAEAAATIAKKTYDRMQNLYNEGVISGQKRDEAFAAYKATEAQVAAARSQYEMAKNGAREQEKRMAANNTQASKSAVDVVKNLLKETVQVAQCEGEVSNVYPKVGELVGLGSPIMSISIMSDMWGTFNVREDHLQGLNKGDEFTAFVPAFNKEIKMKVYYLKDQGSYATWKATKDNGDYDRKTFEVKARPITKLDGLRPGMSLIIK